MSDISENRAPSGTTGGRGPDAGGAGDPPRLLLDAMLGRLARWLRLLGYDAEYAADAGDAEIVRRARAEGRVLLTRDRELLRRRGIRALAVESERLVEQLAQVTAAFPLPPTERAARCMACNEPLRDLAPEAARARVPRHVGRANDSFQECPRCDRVFWRGTHWPAIVQRLDAAGGGNAG